MDLFGIGAGEILLILVVILIIWGPAKIPEIARGLGKTVHAFRKASTDLTTAVTREIEQETILKSEQKPQDGAQSTPSQNGDRKPGEVVGPGESI